MKFPSIKSTRGRQRGAVLVVALIMLVVSTLLVVSMMKTTVLELKIGGSDQIYANNFTNAETAISKFIADNSGRFAPGFLTLSVANGGPIIRPPTGLVGGTVTLAASQVSCTLTSGSTSVYDVLFDVAATARGTLAGSVLIMHQGLLTTAKSCGDSACMRLMVPQGGAGTAHNPTAQACQSSNACIHSPQHPNDCTVFLSGGTDVSGHDQSCDVSSGKDKDGNDCTMKTNPGVTKAYWYVEPEQQ